jgi:hypothetical protein
MKFITPTQITGSMLVSSNVPETPPAAYAGGTTYALGNTASTGTTGGVITVWESLQAANTGHTPSSSPTWWKEIGTTYAAYSGGTTYGLGDVVLSASTHRLYESLSAGNVGNALTDATKWLDIGPTQQWAMLDNVIGTVASRATPITVVIDTGIIDSMALLDLAGTDVTVTMTDGAGGPTVFTENYPLEDSQDVLDWYDYFFSEIIPATTLIVRNLPPYASGRVTVTINAATTAECGTLVIGKLTDIGQTLANPTIGIQDYSRKETDAFGATAVIQRAYAKKVDCRFWLDSRYVDFVARKLSAVRATPVVWIADDQEQIESLVAFGFYRDWGIDIVYPNYSEATISLESLT